MKVYIPYHAGGAGKWIYDGYLAAWKNKGFDVEYIDFSQGLPSPPSEYEVMLVEGGLHHINLSKLCAFLDAATKVYMFVQPHKFPRPWWAHPNFKSSALPEFVNEINARENVHLWSFTNASGTEYYDKWKTVNYVPLAFDAINYTPIKDSSYEYDICYVGGLANNGFDEKKHIMSSYLSPLMESKRYKAGIYVNLNITPEQEIKLLSNSKICLNIHDKYQQVLGLDSNERTFKSLGLNGFLISDDVAEVRRLLPSVEIAKSPRDMERLVDFFLSKNLIEIKEANKELISTKHTYSNRVDQLRSLK